MSGMREWRGLSVSAITLHRTALCGFMEIWLLGDTPRNFLPGAMVCVADTLVLGNMG